MSSVWNASERARRESRGGTGGGINYTVRSIYCQKRARERERERPSIAALSHSLFLCLSSVREGEGELPARETESAALKVQCTAATAAAAAFTLTFLGEMKRGPLWISEAAAAAARQTARPARRVTRARLFVLARGALVALQ